MAKLRDICLPLAIALSTFQLVKSRHKEAYEAKTIVNELSKKLHKKLWTLEDTYHKTKEEIGATIKELAVLKKVDVLLGQLNNRHEPGPLCEHDYILVDFRYKQNILIATRSALPAHYTLSVQGKNYSISLTICNLGYETIRPASLLNVFNREYYIFSLFSRNRKCNVCAQTDTVALLII